MLQCWDEGKLKGETGCSGSAIADVRMRWGLWGGGIEESVPVRFDGPVPSMWAYFGDVNVINPQIRDLS